TGTITKSFVINPVKTTISSLKKGSKSFTVKWKKKTSQVSGYQIRYSTYSSMKKAKTVKVSSYKKTSKQIKKLSKKKKYYVQIRTYKTVKGKAYYSAWSSKKSVKTK
ncbi:MAG: fibronectin type III domain-containing protein, partial [Firmicutes bacterium]|nr:fibronectin type III domain-containing protein [Bacillota bacterium]